MKKNAPPKGTRKRQDVKPPYSVEKKQKRRSKLIKKHKKQKYVLSPRLLAVAYEGARIAAQKKHGYSDGPGHQDGVAFRDGFARGFEIYTLTRAPTMDEKIYLQEASEVWDGYCLYERQAFRDGYVDGYGAVKSIENSAKVAAPGAVKSKKKVAEQEKALSLIRRMLAIGYSTATLSVVDGNISIKLSKPFTKAQQKRIDAVMAAKKGT